MAYFAPSVSFRRRSSKSKKAVPKIHRSGMGFKRIQTLISIAGIGRYVREADTGYKIGFQEHQTSLTQ